MNWHAERIWSVEELYRKIGSSNSELLDMARSKVPDADDHTVALAILNLLLPDKDSEQWHSAAKLVEQLISQCSLGNASRPGSDMNGPRRNDNTKGKGMELVGIAVLAAMACGAAILWLRGHNSNRGGHPPAGAPHSPSAPTPKPKVPAQDIIETVRFAAAILSDKAREMGTEAEKAGDLFPIAMFWWSGTAREWDRTVCSAGLSPLHTLPASDDVLLVSVYETTLLRSAMPTTRFESSAILRNAARNRQLRHIETYEIPTGIKLTQLGFTR